MVRHQRKLQSLGLLMGVGFLAAGCSAGQSPTPETATETATQTTTETATATATETAMEPTSPAIELPRHLEKGGVAFDVPEGWNIEAEECEAECTEYDPWSLRNAQGEHVMTLLPNTATSTDGDMNLYERELLHREPAPNIEFSPTSMIAEYWVATHQEDATQTSGLSVALVDDQVLEKRGEQPDMNYFLIREEAWPMLWVEMDYLEAHGVKQKPTREQAAAFVNSEEFAVIEQVMLSARLAAG